MTAPVLPVQQAHLILEDGISFTGYAFGFPVSVSGEVVFNTGMVGYPETLTDPSYRGQILVLTYPLIGNYGVPAHQRSRHLPSGFESSRIQVKGLVVAWTTNEYSHFRARHTLQQWLYTYKIPAITGVDTRTLTQHLRAKGTMLGKLIVDGDVDWDDPNRRNLVPEVSIARPREYGKGKYRIILVDCGCKESIVRQLVQFPEVHVIRVPWNFDLNKMDYDGLVISNGPGNPKLVRPVILQIRQAFRRKKPILGICLGHQLLALAAGANTFKMKYGHRGQNQPVQDVETGRCFITSQNHGFAVDNRTLPDEWHIWFSNLNDGSNEGIRHRHLPFFGVQFHPEANPGPTDTEFIFQNFVELVKNG